MRAPRPGRRPHAVVQQDLAANAIGASPSSVLHVVPVARVRSTTVPAPWEWRVPIHHILRHRHRGRLCEWYPRGAWSNDLLRRASFRCHLFWRSELGVDGRVELVLLLIRSWDRRDPLPSIFVPPVPIFRHVVLRLLLAHRPPRARLRSARPRRRPRPRTKRPARRPHVDTRLLHLLDLDLRQLIPVNPRIVVDRCLAPLLLEGIARPLPARRPVVCLDRSSSLLGALRIGLDAHVCVARPSAVALQFPVTAIESALLRALPLGRHSSSAVAAIALLPPRAAHRARARCLLWPPRRPIAALIAPSMYPLMLAKTKKEYEVLLPRCRQEGTQSLRGGAFEVGSCMHMHSTRCCSTARQGFLGYRPRRPSLALRCLGGGVIAIAQKRR